MLNAETKQLLNARALQLYLDMDEEAQTVIKFGMLPKDAIDVLEAEYPEAQASEVAVALMDATKANGGMVV